jgi:hypothetical protein
VYARGATRRIEEVSSERFSIVGFEKSPVGERALWPV